MTKKDLEFMKAYKALRVAENKSHRPITPKRAKVCKPKEVKLGLQDLKWAMG